MSPAIAVTASANAGQYFATAAEVSATTCGPNFRTNRDKIKKRTRRPTKMASKKCQKLISNTDAASTNTLNGKGGGSIDGNIKAQNSCRSNELRILLNFVREIRF